MAYAEARRKSPLRWFQWLTAQRRYEVKADGSWCWMLVFESTPRQQGKSVTLSEDAAWIPTLTPDPIWMLHTAHRIRTCHKIQSNLWPWAVKQGYQVRRQLGDSHIIWPNGSDWTTIAMDSAYGSSPKRLLADEAWALDPVKFWNSLFPALGDHENPQCLFWSTANPTEEGLVSDLRADPEVCCMEWGAIPGEDFTDEEVWRLASAYWGSGRLALMRTASKRPGFAEEWLNVWPSITTALPGSPLVEEETWAALRAPGLHVPPNGLIAAMDASTGASGSSAGVSVAWRLPDGSRAVLGRALPTLEAAWRVLGALPHGTTVLVGLTFAKGQRAQSLAAQGVGRRETEQALPLVQDLVKAGALQWDGDDLDKQALALRVGDAAASSGKAPIRSNSPTHVIRTAAWALWQLDQAPAAPAVW